jgi:hypothetical protein
VRAMIEGTMVDLEKFKRLDRLSRDEADRGRIIRDTVTDRNSAPSTGDRHHLDQGTTIQQ